ncbi:loricrin, putative [Trichomonas vaginalis G3]|uniref:receptor protein-tyrosine kinase n=1 Tax=Trichomonas vaginalis (strain ATCC PRA-98 / G3) TaxID=412133 RepID=A2DKZ8_TRIV3|nr:glycine-rich protein family [Trichomonas vaginalis G3]EAY18951.1 loricrin, putative [Trichomonas vaginalis G3]KAI5532017.1 glycine-rich protein family [Trichomonas vaginalis G3]|eukprot:XP_001579937.1 loricrin [Trichomonas vaginalis G3]
MIALIIIMVNSVALDFKLQDATVGTPNITSNKTCYIFYFPCNNYSHCTSYEGILPKGRYRLEVWGAEGGMMHSDSAAKPGKGGYARGIINITSPTKIFIHLGGSPPRRNDSEKKIIYGGYNGGGMNINPQGSIQNGGGGASDIRIENDDLYSRVLVAGGGGYGGKISDIISNQGRSGGGLYGESADFYGISGSTQYSAGSCNYPAHAGSFGFGGNNSFLGGGAGGGWFGGASADPSSYEIGSSGGGSGFVYNYSFYPGFQYKVDSKYMLSKANLIPGNESLPEWDGSHSIGHSGHGVAKITLLLPPKKTEFIDPYHDKFFRQIRRR